MRKEDVHLAELENLDRVFQLVDQVFPFHLIMNKDLKMIQVGKNFKKLNKNFVVDPFFYNHFEMVKPVPCSTIEDFSKNEGDVFILSFLDKEMTFKGEMVVYEEEGIILFLGTPVLSDGEIFLKYNISLSDFAAYDTSPDYLFSIGAQQSAMREVKNLVKKLQNNKEKLTRSNSSLEQFAYVASHDLQSPLRTIVSFAQLLEKKYGKQIDPIGKEYLDFIISGTKRMQQLINDLLEYGKIQQEINTFEVVNISQLIEGITLDLQFDIEKQNAKIEYDNLPSIYANSSLIKQLFQNLISNALKFRQLDDPIIQIEIEDVDDAWLFFVKDNGIGFRMEDGQKIFDIFQRAVGLESYEGTGIGLAICKKVVEKHKGKIWVESEPMVGSIFYFTISKYLSTKF